MRTGLKGSVLFRLYSDNHKESGVLSTDRIVKHGLLLTLSGLLFLFLLSTAFASEVTPKPASASLAKRLNFVHGALTNRYKLRTTGDVRDSDLETLLSFTIGEPAYQRVTAAAQGGGIFDLDGNKSNEYYSDIYNSFSNKSAVGRLYYAYVDIHRVGQSIDLVRTGRQHLYEFDSAYFDGLSFDTVPFYGVKLTGFGGIPVHQFENQLGDHWGDWTVGGALQWTPISRIRSRFEYTHLKDKAAAFRSAQGDQEDDLFSESVWIDITQTIDFYSRLTSFSDQLRDVQAAVGFRLPKKDFSLRLQMFRLLNGYDIRVLEWDAFRIAGTYQPYTEVGVQAAKGIGKHLSVDGGFNWRKLDDKAVASSFNHGYERGYLSLSLQSLPVKGLSFSATADYYRGEDSTLKNNNFGGSFFVAQQLLKKRMTVTAGTAYYLYRYNLLTGTESEDVQAYFARLEGQITKAFRLKGGYEFEHNSLNGFHTVNVSLSWGF